MSFEGWEGGARGPVSCAKILEKAGVDAMLRTSNAVDDEVVREFGNGNGAVDNWVWVEFVFHCDAVYAFDLTVHSMLVSPTVSISARNSQPWCKGQVESCCANKNVDLMYFTALILHALGQNLEDLLVYSRHIFNLSVPIFVQGEKELTRLNQGFQISISRRNSSTPRRPRRNQLRL